MFNEITKKNRVTLGVFVGHIYITNFVCTITLPDRGRSIPFSQNRGAPDGGGVPMSRIKRQCHCR